MREGSKILKNVLKFAKEWIPVILIAFVLNFLITHFVFVINKVPTSSMVPTIQVQDRVFTTKIFDRDNLKYGDILTFNPPLQTKDVYVKRLIGVGGDTIEVKDGHLYINGKKKEEDFIKTSMNYNYGPITVPEGKFFFMGDNRNNSYDSHLWETTPFVDKSEIIGKTIFCLFPFNHMKSL